MKLVLGPERNHNFDRPLRIILVLADPNLAPVVEACGEKEGDLLVRAGGKATGRGQKRTHCPLRPKTSD